jgi:hypothetical protein
VGGQRSREEVDLTVFDLGVVSVGYAFPLDLDVADLPAFSSALYGNPALLSDGRTAVEELLAALGDAVEEPELEPVVEDYVVFRVDGGIPEAPPADLLDRYAAPLAGALRAETEPLSPEEIQDALTLRISYGREDLTVVDWFAALLVGDGMDDELAVLELATVELLALRVLDRQLDQGLEDAYRHLREPRPLGLFPRRAQAAERVARLQTEAALLLEGATNPAKLLGDQYLARMYRLVARRFHLPEWGEAVDRKLEALDSAYQKLTDRNATRRLETLEWIIIVLIALSIALYFVPVPW